ncbi:flavodoxin family protein [Cytobacillus gottheilii]|uniref:flavodoxin family protein n=1 Tax=Cytobacillus gottheilii TaxID=859144 RepID=UPI0009BAF847|nr:flavodoxin family protein [Cytobacillus gottheilii]
MKKVFVYIGSRNDDSTLTVYLNKLLHRLKEIDSEIQVDLHTATSTNINHSTGCKNCFTKGFCNQDHLDEDSMSKIKTQLLDADFIILASPVYSHNVSSDMKAFVDRLSYWGHLFRLAGKPAMFFASGTNGLNYVLSYMEKVMNYMGVIGVGRVSLIPNPDLYDDIESNIEEIIAYTKGFKEAKSNDTIEAAFLSYRFLFKDYPRDHAEYLYWKNNGLFECDSFKEYLDKIKIPI